MKIKYILSGLLIVIISTTAAQAQYEPDPQFGIKGGLNLANMTIEGADDNNLQAGFHAGVFVKIPFSEEFALQPEVYYSQKGVKTRYDEDFLGIDVADGLTKFNMNYIDVPVLLVYNLSSDFNFHLGPYVGFLLDANVDAQAEVLDFIEFDDTEKIDKDHFNSLDYGISAGLGFEFDNINLGFNYNIGLAQAASEDEVGDILLGDARHNVIQIYAGISF